MFYSSKRFFFTIIKIFMLVYFQSTMSGLLLYCDKQQKTSQGGDGTVTGLGCVWLELEMNGMRWTHSSCAKETVICLWPSNVVLCGINYPVECTDWPESLEVLAFNECVRSSRGKWMMELKRESMSEREANKEWWRKKWSSGSLWG